MYFMPALLPHMDSDIMSLYLLQSTPLIIRPKHGCIPSGLFCCLVAHFLSPTNLHGWKVCMERDRPLCLYRNCISIIQQDATETVTLVDKFLYIEVHLFANDDTSNYVYGEIRDHVNNSIKSACSVLNYCDVQFDDAFVCAGASCASDPPHASVVVHSKSQYKWKCTIIERQNGRLSNDQLKWLSTVDYCTAGG